MIYSKNRWVFLLLAHLALLFLAFIFSCVASSSSILDNPLNLDLQIFYLRLNRSLLAGIAGAVLAICGGTLQAIFKNHLADPYIIGVSAGASIGKCICIIFFGQALILQQSIFAISGASTVAILLLLAIAYQNNSNNNALLIGITINSFASAFIVLTIAIVPTNISQDLYYWLIGRIDYIENLDLILLFTISIFGIIVLLINAGKLEILSLGNDEASRLGVDVKKIQLISIAIISIMVGILVVFVGMIGFVGFIIPHVIRKLFGADLRIIMPLATIFGATILLIFDGLSRIMFYWLYSQIPIGVFTALIGAPIFIKLVFNNPRSDHI